MQPCKRRNHLYGALSFERRDVTSNSNLPAIAECTPPQTYTEVCAFLDLVSHYRRFTKGFACIAQLLSEHLAGEGDSRKLEWVSLSEDALKAFKALK